MGLPAEVTMCCWLGGDGFAGGAHLLQALLLQFRKPTSVRLPQQGCWKESKDIVQSHGDWCALPLNCCFPCIFLSINADEEIQSPELPGHRGDIG